MADVKRPAFPAGQSSRVSLSCLLYSPSISFISASGVVMGLMKGEGLIDYYRSSVRILDAAALRSERQ